MENVSVLKIFEELKVDVEKFVKRMGILVKREIVCVCQGFMLLMVSVLLALKDNIMSQEKILATFALLFAPHAPTHSNVHSVNSASI